jgi:L-fuconate dehydratase
MSIKITGFETYDVRFPTSRRLDGSDAMNPSPDYSSAYLIIRTDSPDGLAGYSYVFTIGRGNDIQLSAVRDLESFLAGRDLDAVLADLGGLSRQMIGDSPLRWLGPECGVVHMAIGAVLNACWDLAARRAGLPLWRLLAELSPSQIVDLVDFRYLADALTRDEALALLRRGADGKNERIALLERDGYPAYTTTPGWLGYSDSQLAALCSQAVAAGFRRVKLKVGARLEDDVRRITIARDAVGDEVAIALDANQVWDVPTAISWMRELAPLGPDWIEEPTSPDDILGTAAIRRGISPVRVATGEHVANRVIFKQLLQAEAIDVMQIDACRVAGVNENLANLLLAAKFGIPVCPHAGGVGLCEIVQHLAMFDYVALSGTLENRSIEWIDHLHEHFIDPAIVRGGRYVTPVAAGASTRMRPESLVEYSFPAGPAWLAQITPHRGRP